MRGSEKEREWERERVRALDSKKERIRVVFGDGFKCIPNMTEESLKKSSLIQSPKDALSSDKSFNGGSKCLSGVLTHTQIL